MNGTAHAAELPASAQMMQMLAGKWVSKAISVAAELGVADLLVEGSKSTAEIAAACGAHEPSLYRLLRALASIGVFTESEERRFALTSLAECLRSDSNQSVRNQARFMCTPATWELWGDLLHCVRTGETAVQHLHGYSDAFQLINSRPEEAEVFNAAMTDYSRQSAPAIAAAYDFARFRRLIDVGAGHGYLIATVLQQNPDLLGGLYELPQVAAGAREKIAAAGLADRCDVIEGSFFESVPAGADGYMMKHIIHDWDDERAGAILRNCRKAIPRGGRLLLMESVVPEANAPSFGKLLDLEMLVIPGGRERTETEYAELLASSGFRLSSITNTPMPVSIIEAMPA